MAHFVRNAVPAAEVQKKFGYYQDEAIRAPVLISKNGRPKTVLVSHDEYMRLVRRDRRVYVTDNLPSYLVEAINDLTIPKELEEHDHEL
jgi:prevent-host-death family protein